MPLYEYECESCGLRFEVIQRFSDSAVDHCKRCNGPVHKLLSAPAIHFKGTGWYVTDYAKKGAESATTPPADSSADKNGTGKSDSEEQHELVVFDGVEDERFVEQRERQRVDLRLERFFWTPEEGLRRFRPEAGSPFLT